MVVVSEHVEPIELDAVAAHDAGARSSAVRHRLWLVAAA